jgi:hypothetical protein
VALGGVPQPGVHFPLVSVIPPTKPARDLTLEDDDELDLPEAADALGDEEPAGLEDELDDDLSDEDVGLDGDTGLDEALDDELDDPEEEGSWLDDGAAARDADELDDELGEDDEQDWAEGSEPLGDADEDWDDELGADDGKSVAADSGEEGFGDDSVLAGLELEKLPPLDDSGEGSEGDAAAEAFGAELLDALTRDLSGDEALEEIAAGLRCSRIPATRVALREVHRAGRPLQALLCAGDGAAAWEDGLLVREGVEGRAERRATPTGKALALAATQIPNGMLLALCTPDGLYRSEDGGRSFVRALAFADGEQPFASLAWSSGEAPRLWAVRAGGPLLSSDDRGASFRSVREDVQVLRLASSADGELIVIARGPRGEATVLCSADGGHSFGTVEPPVDVVERLQDVQVSGQIALCCRRAPQPQLLVARGSDAFLELAPTAMAPACLVTERGEAWAYFFVLEGALSLLLRKRVSQDDATLELVVELAADAGTPLRLSGRSREDATVLEIGTERAWYVLRLAVSEPA